MNLRVLSFVVAGLALAAAFVAAGVAFFPPEPDCSAGGGVYCEAAAFARLKDFVVLMGYVSLVLLLAAVGVYLAHIKIERGAGGPTAPGSRLKHPAPQSQVAPGKGVSFQRASSRPGEDARPPERPKSPETPSNGNGRSSEPPSRRA